MGPRVRHLAAMPLGGHPEWPVPRMGSLEGAGATPRNTLCGASKGAILGGHCKA